MLTNLPVLWNRLGTACTMSTFVCMGVLITLFGCGRSWSEEENFTEVTGEVRFDELVGLDVDQVQARLEARGWVVGKKPKGLRWRHPFDEDAEVPPKESFRLGGFRPLWFFRSETLLVSFAPDGRAQRFYNRFTMGVPVP